MGSLPTVRRRVVRASFALAIAGAFVAMAGGQSLFPNPQIKAGFYPYYEDDAVAVGDLDADGFSDLILAEVYDGKLSIHHNQAGCGFVKTATLPFAVHSPTAMDWNLDGRLDIVCGGIVGGGPGLFAFLGDGHGNLLPPTTLAPAGFVHGLATADFDGDGNPDLLGRDWAGGVFQIVFGDGQGGTAHIATIPWPVILGGVNDIDVADVDGDGDIDFACTTFEMNGLKTYLNDGLGQFSPPLASGGSLYAAGLRFTDWTGDGKVDILTSNSVGAIHCCIGQGNGSFTVGPAVSVGHDCWNLELCDIDADGSPEVLATDAPSDSLSVVRRASPLGGFLVPISVPVGNFPSGMACADFDRDGRMDVAVENGLGASVSILRGIGGGQFEVPGVVALSMQPHDLAVGDLDSDGFDDVVVAGHLGLASYRADGQGGFAVSSALAVSGSLDHVALADFNGDGFDDVVSLGDRLRIHLRTAPGTFVESSSTSIFYAPTCMTVLDFNRDGNPDVAVGRQTPIQVELYAGDGQGALREPRHVDTVGWPVALVYADLDGDALEDLIVTSAAPVGLSVFHGVASGGFGAVSRVPLGFIPVECEASDLDRDGDTDLIVGNNAAHAGPWGESSIAVLWNDGHGNLSVADRVETGSRPAGFVRSDLDRDGWLDLLCADVAANALTVVKGGASGFQQPLLFGCGGSNWLSAEPILARIGNFDAIVGADAVVLDWSRRQFTVFRNLMPYVPETYCTAKVTSQGCTPHVSSLGQPRISLPTPFWINASDLPSGVHGLLMYSKSALAQIPFHGGTLCIEPPIVRLPAVDSGGVATCGGRFGFDFAVWIASGADPGLIAGQPLWAQYYFRDPGDPFGAGLTDAITVTVRP